MSELYKVAVAINEEGISDVRFGQLEKVRIYNLTPNGIEKEEIRLIPKRECDPNACGCHGKDEKFLNAVGELLEDCDYLVIDEIGSYPYRVFLRHGVQVLEQSGDVEKILQKLNDYLRK